MKLKYLFFLFLGAVSTSSFGQLSHRNFIIDGNAAAQLFTANGDTDLIITGTPTLSYFMSDNFVIGGGIQLANVIGTGSSFGLNGTTRYYFSNQATNAWFAVGNIGFLTGSGLNIFTGNVGIGLDLFLSPNIAFENTLSIGFRNDEVLLNNALVFQLGTGFKFFFDRKPEGSENGRNGILKKGSLFLGMTAGNIEISTQNGAKSSILSLSPNIGKFINDNWVLGVNASLLNQAFLGFNNFSVTALPFLRYYPNAGEKRAILFGEVGAGIRLESFTGNRIINETTTNPTFMAGIGLNYFLRPTVAFEIKGSYNYLKQSFLNDTNSIGVNFGFQFFFRKEA